MIRLIAAHKVASIIIAVVVIGGGTVGGVVATNPTGNTCNGGCITGVHPGPTTFTPPPWEYRVDSMSVCINNDFGFEQIDGFITGVFPLFWALGLGCQLTELPIS